MSSGRRSTSRLASAGETSRHSAVAATTNAAINQRLVLLAPRNREQAADASITAAARAADDIAAPYLRNCQGGMGIRLCGVGDLGNVHMLRERTNKKKME